MNLPSITLSGNAVITSGSVLVHKGAVLEITPSPNAANKRPLVLQFKFETNESSSEATVQQKYIAETNRFDIVLYNFDSPSGICTTDPWEIGYIGKVEEKRRLYLAFAVHSLPKEGSKGTNRLFSYTFTEVKKDG